MCSAILSSSLYTGYRYYQNYQTMNWKGTSKKRLTRDEMDAYLANAINPKNTVICQSVSDSFLSWTGHQGMAGIEDWAGFVYQKCATIPTSISTNSNLSAYYDSLGPASPSQDPCLTDSQQIDSTGKTSLENPIAGKTLSLSGTGVLSLKSGGTAIWSTPSGPPDSYTLGFDSNVYNLGNLCVFPSGGKPPLWCMLPQITVQTMARQGSGPSIQDIQQTQLNTAHLKNFADTAPRFAMISDSGAFCMHRGTPGNIQGTFVICK